jgi:hypothetical protein
MRRTLFLSILLALAGCKKPYDRDDFNPVCDGKGLESAAAYDPASSAQEVPVAIVMHYAKTEGWIVNTPKRFYANGVPAPSKDNYQTVQLALCVDQQPGPFDRDCGDMEGFNATVEPDGKSKATATGTTSVVKAYGSHYILNIREAKTARVVATKTVDVKVEQCPMLVLGNTAADRSTDYVQLSEDELAAFLAPHLPKAVSARLLAARPE